MSRKEDVIDIINMMISHCEPFTYSDFNMHMKAKSIKEIRKLEQEQPKVGLSRFGEPDEGISTLSIIATITDILVDERLSFIMEDDGTVSGVKWFKGE